jgi:hypothetical protein
MRASERFRVVLASLLCSLSFVPLVAAQGSGTGAPPMQPLSPFEEFVDRLKLDAKTQLPEVQQILTAAARDVVAPAQEMEQARQRLVVAELANRHADADPLLAAHRAAAMKKLTVEVKAFAQIYALLKPNQQAKVPQAFDIMLGLLEPQTNVGGRGPRGGRGGGTDAGGVRYAVANATTAALAPQRGGGGGGGGSDGGAYKPSRFEVLETALSLTKDQKKSAKTLLDDAYKAAAPLREGLGVTRAAVVAAIQGGKSGADLDTTVAAHAEQVTAMASAEVVALARVVLSLEETQRGNTAGVASSFSIMRNAFVGKKWDEIPAGR